MKRFSDLTILFVSYSLLRIFNDTIEESHDALGIDMERIKYVKFEGMESNAFVMRGSKAKSKFDY